ncbi:MAG: hypothetical protein U9R25_02355 [Chloroflexota bacterium]|nr:hypothetical protein [Chloroflexota bacterium]
MAPQKLVVWNMQWMNDLFGPNNLPPAFRPDDEKPIHFAGTTIRERRNNLAGVIDDLAPDLMVIVEGPNRTGELQLFFDTDIKGEWLTQVQYSKGQSQNIGLAVRIDQGKFDDKPFRYFDTNNLDAFDPFTVDTDDDEISENYHFDRRPLYVEIRPKEGRKFRILGLHLKSKGIFKAYEWSKWWSMSDANRRKILAQATQLRLEFLDPYLTSTRTGKTPIIVCGDINDGPGLDASEKRLYGSAVERLMGTVWKPELCLGNALFDSLTERQQEKLDFSNLSTTSFRDPIFNNTYHHVWIDHIIYSKNMPVGWVRDADVPMIYAGQPFRIRYPHASDHYPVLAEIDTREEPD